MTAKPRILLIPNVAWWIIGEMGRQIIVRFGDTYDFYFVPEGLFERRPELLWAFLPYVDAVHCLNESSIELFRNLESRVPLPPVATWIHHVTEWSPQHQLAVERSSALTVCTPGWKSYLQSKVPSPPPITVVPHGVDLDFFKPRQPRPETFHIPPGRFVVGFIGAKGSDLDGGRKGTDTLLQVIRQTGAHLPELHVVLGGPGWEPELEDFRKLGISASATGYLRKADLPHLYSALDVYLMTSRVEGGPCTVFEAMACETAVVATRVGAVPDLICDGVSGYSAEVDDVAALSAAVLRLARSADRGKAIGKEGRAVVSRGTWHKALEPLGDLYAGLTKHSGRRTTQGDPRWMHDPAGLARTSSAADALGNVIARWQKGSVGAVQGLRLLLEMLDPKSLRDAVKGLALLRGLTYKPRSSPAGSARALERTG